jgi:hypothetical protein
MQKLTFDPWLYVSEGFRKLNRPNKSYIEMSDDRNSSEEYEENGLGAPKFNLYCTKSFYPSLACLYLNLTNTLYDYIYR